MGIKYVHIVTVVLSFAGFFLRGLLMLRGSPIYWPPSARATPPHGGRTRPHRGLYVLVRIVPHVNDTLLLAAGIALTLRLQQYPFVHGWLTAKLAGLLAYIGLGLIALRFGRSRRVRLAAWVAALVVYLYIVGVALTRDAALGLWRN